MFCSNISAPAQRNAHITRKPNWLRRLLKRENWGCGARQEVVLSFEDLPGGEGRHSQVVHCGVG